MGLKEMKFFAVQTGFPGDDDVWAGEFKNLCADYNIDPVSGCVDLATFVKLLDDDSEKGLYQSDEELKELRASLSSKADKPEADAPKVETQEPAEDPSTKKRPAEDKEAAEEEGGASAAKQPKLAEAEDAKS